MSKSYGSKCLGFMQALLEDASIEFPIDRADFSRDYKRLRSLLETRGLRLFTIDLPELGKHLDRCLTEAVYTKSELPLSRCSSPSVVVPRLFRALYLRIFEDNGCLKESPDVAAIAFLRQALYGLKKLKLNCEQWRIRDAVSTFHRTDLELAPPFLEWNSEDPSLFQPSKGLTLRTFGERPTEQGGLEYGYSRGLALDLSQSVFDWLLLALGPYSPGSGSFKHGPGAVSDLSKGDYKYNFPSWSLKLEYCFPQAEYANANYTHWLHHGGLEERSDHFSKLIAVPKNLKTPRLIAAEPTCNQWAQQSIWSWFKAKTSDSVVGQFVHFGDQTFNQRTALEGSATGALSTIDLSEASDRVSCRLVERVFRLNPELLTALYSTRTTRVVQTISRASPTEIPLNKFSTMGNACTFPVESFIFLGFTLTACLLKAGKTSLRHSDIARAVRPLIGKVHVFGDDIVCPTEATGILSDLLAAFSFKVNADKSFTRGKFRESCGCDAFMGHDVTPAYVTGFSDKPGPELIERTCQLSNNFFLKGYWRTASYLQSTVEHLVDVVPIDSGLTGLVSPTADFKPPNRVRWNEAYQRWEERSALLTAKQTRSSEPGFGPLLQYFTENPSQDLPWKSGTDSRPRFKLTRGWYPIGERRLSFLKLDGTHRRARG